MPETQTWTPSHRCSEPGGLAERPRGLPKPVSISFTPSEPIAMGSAMKGKPPKCPSPCSRFGDRVIEGVWGHRSRAQRLPEESRRVKPRKSHQTTIAPPMRTLRDAHATSSHWRGWHFTERPARHWRYLVDQAEDFSPPVPIQLVALFRSMQTGIQPSEGLGRIVSGTLPFGAGANANTGTWPRSMVSAA